MNSNGIELLNKVRTLREENKRLQEQLEDRDGIALAEAKDKIPKLEKAVTTYLGRWQRVLKAYVSLREVKSLRDDEVHTPALAKYLALHESLDNGDQKVLP